VLNKKVRRAALIAALSQRVKESAVCVVDQIALAEAKTRRMVELLGTLGLQDQGVLIVLPDRDVAVERAARNLPRVSVIAAAGLNTHDVLRHRQLLMTRAALEAVEKRLSGASKETSA
jgi:large subunit ribosomal protein L4